VLYENDLFLPSLFFNIPALKGKGKATVKIGMQCGKLITDSRFYKPLK